MKDNNCFYCEDGQKRHELMYEVCKMDLCTLYVLRNQKHRGRMVLKFDDHVPDISALSEDQNRRFFGELRKVAAALMSLFHPDKINYAIYGDLVPHLHVHIVPKYKGGPEWGGPFVDGGEAKILDDAQLEEIAKAMRAELKKGEAK